MKITAFFLFFAIFVSLKGQTPWRLSLSNSEERIDLVIDLHNESIEVPGLELFGPLNGYLGGDIYGVWYVTSFDISAKGRATIKVANDLGSEVQKIALEQLTDSTWSMKLLSPNVVKRVKGRRLVKIGSQFVMKRKQ